MIVFGFVTTQFKGLVKVYDGFVKLFLLTVKLPGIFVFADINMIINKEITVDIRVRAVLFEAVQCFFNNPLLLAQEFVTYVRNGVVSGEAFSRTCSRMVVAMMVGAADALNVAWQISNETLAVGQLPVMEVAVANAWSVPRSKSTKTRLAAVANANLASKGLQKPQ